MAELSEPGRHLPTVFERKTAIGRKVCQADAFPVDQLGIRKVGADLQDRTQGDGCGSGHTQLNLFLALGNTPHLLSSAA